MIEVSPLHPLGKVSVAQAAEVFRDFLYGLVHEVTCEVMAA